MGVNIGNDDMDELWVSMDADGNGSVDWRVRSSFDCIINRIRVQSYVKCTCSTKPSTLY